MSAAVVYRHFDSAGELLYIGCTTQPLHRREAARRSSGEARDWIDLVASTTTQEFDSRAAALRAESAAIASELPRHNIMGKPRTPRHTKNAVDLLSVRQAAAELHITERAVRHRISVGTLAATKLGPGTAAYVIARAEIERVKADSEKAAS